MTNAPDADRVRKGPVVTRQDIAEGLRDLGVRAGDVIWAHSSLSAFGYVEGGTDAVIAALLDAVGLEGSVALPTFTWGAFHDKRAIVFDVTRTPCETGRIPETFRQREGVRRGIHVCHSVAAVGPATEKLLGDGVHSFWGNAVFDALYELNGWNLMLGVSYQSCTALHAAEEKVQVPYRDYRDFANSRVRLADGRHIPAPSVEYLRQDDSFNDFAKMEDILRDRGMLTSCQIGAATVTAARIRNVIDVAVAALQEDPRFLSGQR